MNRWVHLLTRKLLVEQIEQPIFGDEGYTVEFNGKSSVEVRVVAHHALDVLVLKVEFTEERFVGKELNIGAVLILYVIKILLINHAAAAVLHQFRLPLAETLNAKAGRQRVNRLDTNPV